MRIGLDWTALDWMGLVCVGECVCAVERKVRLFDRPRQSRERTLLAWAKGDVWGQLPGLRIG